ncbi:hypothetical protein MXB_1314, partial [Myxobolus squamalis]
MHKGAYLRINVRNADKVDEIGLTINERECLFLSITSNMKKVYIPRDPKSFNGRIWQIVESSIFQILIMIVIILNTILYALLVHIFFYVQWEDMNGIILVYVTFAKLGITAIFILE